MAADASPPVLPGKEDARESGGDVLFGCGAAFNIASIPRTTFDTSLRSATLSFDLASPKQRSGAAGCLLQRKGTDPFRIRDSRWRSLRHALVRGRAA
ncbi:MAG: hypothetical protein AUH13_15095 [Acidobacteria bacterium 13_2_20CM_58_27]|nr:MAG: hypothetical protein AUH13_15095 [Acidobacteria bacterium 13_2_20CM_58_27]